MQALSATRRRWLIAFALSALCAYFGVAVAVDARPLAAGLAQLGGAGIALVLGLSLINYGLRYWRWAGYLTALGHRIPHRPHLAYYLGGFALTVTPGKAGEALRGAYLHRHGVPWKHSLAALFAERLLDLLAITALVALTAGGLAGWRGLGLALGAGVLVLAWLLGRPALPGWLLRRGQSLPGPAGQALEELAGLLRAASQLLQAARLYPALLVGILAWGAEGLGLYWLAQSLGLALGPEGATAIYAIAVLAGAAAFFMPGGLGGMEAAMTALLMGAGASLASAFAITVLCRFATLWFAVLLGVIALLGLELRPPPRPLPAT